jgi:hypothetical protein
MMAGGVLKCRGLVMGIVPEGNRGAPCTTLKGAVLNRFYLFRFIFPRGTNAADKKQQCDYNNRG